MSLWLWKSWRHRGETNFYYIFNQVEEKVIKSKEGPKKYRKLHLRRVWKNESEVIGYKNHSIWKRKFRSSNLESQRASKMLEILLKYFLHFYCCEIWERKSERESCRSIFYFIFFLVVWREGLSKHLKIHYFSIVEVLSEKKINE